MDTKKEMKVQAKGTLRFRIENNLTILKKEVWQSCPNTAVKIWAEWRGCQYVAIGFAKVCWPDIWNAEYGVNLAHSKAIAKISKFIAGIMMKGEDPTTHYAQSDGVAL